MTGERDMDRPGILGFGGDFDVAAHHEDDVSDLHLVPGTEVVLADPCPVHHHARCTAQIPDGQFHPRYPKFRVTPRDRFRNEDEVRACIERKLVDGMERGV